MTAAELNVVIKAKDQSKKAFTAAKGNLNKFGIKVKNVVKSAGDRFKSLSKGLATFAKRGAIALAAFGAAVGYAFVKALKETIAFEMQMAKVSTMLDATSRKLLPEFRKAIIGISLEFGEATESLTDGAYDILSAMVAPSAAMKVLKTGTTAAIAGFTDTKTAISAILTAMKAFGIETSKVTDISDKFLTIQERGRTTLAEMAPVFGRLAAMAVSAGASFEETAAAMATVTREGLPTVLAITSLSSAYGTFLIASDDARKAAKRAGFELTQQWLKTHSLRRALELILRTRKKTGEELVREKKRTKSLTLALKRLQAQRGLTGDALKLNKRRIELVTKALEKIHKARAVELKDVFATKDSLLAVGLLMENLGGFTKDTTAMTKDFAGATKRAADKIKNQLGFQLKRLGKGFVEVGKAMTEKFGAKLKPIIEEANRTMPRLIELFGELGTALADKIGPHMEKFVEYLRTVTKEKLVAQFGKFKEAFQAMVPYIQGAAVAMLALYAASHLTAIEIGLVLAGYKLIYEIGKKIGGAGRLLMGKGVSFAPATKEDAKFMESIGFSQKKINEYASGHSAQKGLELQREGIELMKEKAHVMDFLIDRSKKAMSGELSMAEEFKNAFEGIGDVFKTAFEPILLSEAEIAKLKEIKDKVTEQATKEKEINKLLENRKKILEALNKARAKVPVETGRVRMLGKETVFTKEHPAAGIPAEEFDKLKAQAEEKNRAIDESVEVFKTKINELIEADKNGTLSTDKLNKGILNIFNEVVKNLNASVAVDNQLKNALESVKNSLQSLGSKIASVSKAVANVTKTVASVSKRQIQLAGQGA